MNRRSIIARAGSACIALLPALVMAGAVRAQVPESAQDFRLPPSAPSPTPAPAGPVDSENPTAGPTRAAPTPTPAPTPAPEAAPPPLVALPSPSPTAATRSSPRAPAPAVPAAEPTAPPPLSEGPAPSFGPVQIEASPEPTVEPPVNTMAPPPAGASSAWPWYAGGAALAIALTVAFLRRRRPEEQEEPEEQAFEPAAEPSAPAVLTRPAPPYAPPPSPSPPRPEPQPERPLPEPAAGPIEMEFEARHLSRAMVNATLAYRLTLTNRAASALGPLRIAGDIVTAHSSLSANDQLAAPDESLATVHAIDALAPGESASLSGELRLPLASILPIHSGGMRVFVPLARFRAAVEGGPSVTRIFVVGQESERPGGALRPFVLDRGPGVDRSLGQRQLGLPA